MFLLGLRAKKQSKGDAVNVSFVASSSLSLVYLQQNPLRKAHQSQILAPRGHSSLLVGVLIDGEDQDGSLGAKLCPSAESFDEGSESTIWNVFLDGTSSVALESRSRSRIWISSSVSVSSTNLVALRLASFFRRRMDEVGVPVVGKQRKETR